MSLKIGDAGYRIIEPIASGGMGDVYKAEHVITKRVEAIKVLSGAGTEAQTDRFLREIQLQASLSHPNIAAVYNAFRFDDDLVMVMELVEGEPLRNLLTRGALPISLTLDYICQILDAVGYAHAHGVIHRDITPANIVITPQGVVKLMDFGLAKTASSPSASQSGAYMGSPHYMSPEQVKDAMRASARSDIYSLGAVLYEMVTGQKVFAFAGDSSFAVMQAQVESAPAPPIELNRAIPAELNAAILTALEKEPERRFADADAFRRAILHSPKAVAIAPLQPPKVRPRRLLAPAFIFAASSAAILLPVGIYELSRRPAREVKHAPPTVEVRPVPLPTVELAPPVVPPAAEPPQSPVPPPVYRPPRKKLVKRPVKSDLSPTVIGEGRHLAPVGRNVEPTGPEAATLAPAVAPAPQTAPEPIAVEPRPSAESPVATPPAAPDVPLPIPEEPTAAAKDKKPHGRIRRTLGKIFGPFH